MKVKFTQDVIYETKGRGQGPHYKTGEVHDLREDLAQKWINRGVAEDASAGSRAPLFTTPKEKEKPKPPERKRAANAASITIAKTWRTALTDKEIEALANHLVDVPVATQAEAAEVIEAELAERAKK